MRNSILILLFCSSIIFGQKKENGIINFDGIYQTKCEFANNEKEGEKSFLRFYPNQKVISVSTECDATVSDLKIWFNMEMQDTYTSIGDYEMRDRKIKFSTTSAAGTVKYKGHLTKKGVLKLKTESLINGNKYSEKYEFIKVTDLR